VTLQRSPYRMRERARVERHEHEVDGGHGRLIGQVEPRHVVAHQVLDIGVA